MPTQPKPTKKQQQPKRKPLGKAIVHTDEELDILSQITPSDIEAAKALWEANAPDEYKRLLDAKPEEDQNPNAD